jgi:hypothetical protein
MDFLRELIKLNEGFMPDFHSMSDAELMDLCAQLEIEDMCELDDDGKIINREEVIRDLEAGHGDVGQAMTNHGDIDTPSRDEPRMECVVMDGKKKVKEFDTLTQAKEYVGKHKDKKLTIKEGVKQYTKHTNLRKSFDFYKPVKMKKHVKEAYHSGGGGEAAARANASIDRAARGGAARDEKRTVYPNAKIVYSKNNDPVGEIYMMDRHKGIGWGVLHYGLDYGYEDIESEKAAFEALKELHREWAGRERARRSRGSRKPHPSWEGRTLDMEDSATSPYGPRMESASPRFPNVSCSQCGKDFGPGDHGYSHCKDHKNKKSTSVKEGTSTMKFKNPYKKIVSPSHGGRQGDVKNKSAKQALEDKIGNAGLKGMKKKDRPYMEKPRFRDWLTGNMYFNMTRSGELAGKMNLGESGEFLPDEAYNELAQWAQGRGVQLHSIAYNEKRNTVNWAGTHRNGDEVHGEYDLNTHEPRWTDIKNEYDKERVPLRRMSA